jgi:predicted ABC-type sugar transport system permease subunit
MRTITVKLGYSNIGFCDTLSIASNIINIVVLIIQQYSFITTQFLGPFDDVITKFYCIFSV